ncbi:MAG: S-adenosylmethionine:tRNA ribosyltransferase-isomerase, partial [Pseudomonadota bacterium]
MRRSQFTYSLPPELIAQSPLSERGASRLLVLNGADGSVRDLRFFNLPELLRPDDLLVFNDTRVIPARLYGRKDSGGRIEIMIERIRDPQRVSAQLRASKPPRAGSSILLDGGGTLKVLARLGDFYELAVEGPETVSQVLARIGHVPLPPYIARVDAAADRERYQTVYARDPGA